jgi:hypothetical protein
MVDADMLKPDRLLQMESVLATLNEGVVIVDHGLRAVYVNDVLLDSSVGGDFGLVLPHSDELLSLLVCELSGHGISLALVANRIYSENLHELEHNIGLGSLLPGLHGFVHEHNWKRIALLGCSA